MRHEAKKDTEFLTASDLTQNINFYLMEQNRNLNRVMEAETIKKNGASPKSLMSRGNFIIFFLLYLNLSIIVVNAQNPVIDMIFVQGGTFTMGCTPEQGNDCDDDEKPAHKVTVSDFYIGKYEVTQAQWKAVMGNNPSGFKGDNLPVERVSWDDVQEFIRKLNAQTGKQYRLPTEAEWEFAARGGNKSKGYKYSGSNTPGDVAWAWYDDNSGQRTHNVGTKSPNELGIYDMSGNVFEWCNNYRGDYSSNVQNNPKGPSTGSARVVRGGSWDYNTRYLRVSHRFNVTPAGRNSLFGFRLVLSSK